MITLSAVTPEAGRYLAHSLWQGPVLLLAYLALRRWQTDTRPEANCRAAAVGVVLLALLPLLTALSWLLTGQVPSTTVAPPPDSVGLIPVPGQVLLLLQRHLTLELSQVLVWVWLAGVVISLLHVLVGVGRLNLVLGSTGKPLALPALESLSGRAGLAVVPDVREWAGAAAPFVAGWLRPVIVLPSGLRRLLSEGEFEAVLLHELAHIKRKDVRNNLLLRLVGAFAWHQLPLRKLMGDLARDRELCCDELAVRTMGRTLPLARALIALEECRAMQPRLVMAGTGGDFSHRVRRILAGGRSTGAFRRGTIAVLIALLTVTASTMLVAASAEGQLAVWAEWMHASIKASDPRGPFTVELIGRRLVSATIDGEPIPAERIVQHGGKVQMLDVDGRPELTLEVRAPGIIQWSPRPPRSP